MQLVRDDKILTASTIISPDGKSKIARSALMRSDDPELLARFGVEKREPPRPEPRPVSEPTYEERVEAAMEDVAPVHVLLKEIILAMNYMQLINEINWPAPMDAIINKTLRKLQDHDALERERNG